MLTAVITITKHDMHQVILAAMKTTSSLHVILTAAGDAATTSASSEEHQVTTAVMKSTRSLHVISAGAGDHHQLSAGCLGGFSAALTDQHTKKVRQIAHKGA